MLEFLLATPARTTHPTLTHNLRKPSTPFRCSTLCKNCCRAAMLGPGKTRKHVSRNTRSARMFPSFATRGALFPASILFPRSKICFCYTAETFRVSARHGSMAKRGNNYGNMFPRFDRALELISITEPPYEHLQFTPYS